MASLREALSDSVRNFMCSAASDADPFRDWFAGATSGIPGVGAIASGADTLGDRVSGLVCPGPGGGASGGGGAGATYPPREAPKGQCDGVVYRGTFRYERPDGLSQLVGIPPVYGPIEAIQPRPGSNGRIVECICRGGASGPLRPPGTSVSIASASNNEFAVVTEVNPVRQDGRPDDCGEVPPQQPPTGDDTITYDGPDGNPIPDVDVTFNPSFPIIGPGGILYMPIEVCFLAVCLDVNFNLSTGDIVFNFGGEPDASPCCPPAEDLPEDEGEEDPPPPEDDTRYVGVITTATLNGDYVAATQIGDGVGPDLYVPRIGVVRFAIAIGGRRSYTVDQSIKQLHQVTYVNAPSAAYAWSVLPDKGFDIQSTGVPVQS